MRRVIVGTAGHIDHGKTTLLQALTGIDCDRWREEKQRGITIDLGFAHLERDDLQIGFVDVPGHERFVDNALAGLGGIRIMLLVVAADEGVKPQTREHLDICSLLEIPVGIVALTKTDLVSDELADLARLEVEELLAGSRFEESKILPVSGVTGDGIRELEQALLELAREFATREIPPGADEPARLPIDRAFVLQGLGVVITGTLAAGRIRAGDSLETAPGRHMARVRSVQVHGGERSEAVAGERTALRLAGVELEQLERGTQLVTPETYLETTRLVAHLILLAGAPKPLRGWTPVRFHLLSADRPGRLRPLSGPIEPRQSGVVEIRLAEPVVAAPGDRWICRRLSPALTLGGGEVLDPGWTGTSPKHRATALASLEGSLEDRLVHWIARTGLTGATTQALAKRAGLGHSGLQAPLDRLLSEHKILSVSGAGSKQQWIAPSAFRRLEEKAGAMLADYFRQNRLAAAMPKAEALNRLLPRQARPIGEIYLDWLSKRKILSVAGDKVGVPGREANLSSEESDLSRTVLRMFEAGGLTPPAPADLRAATRAKPQVLDGVVEFHVRRGELEKLPGDLIIAASAVARVRRELGALEVDSFTVPEFKDRFELTRKWAIPLLEHLDSLGVTRRVGNSRQIVRTRPKE
ncbi:MAG: selenocysteine-specific translation elongation factor [bacterium]|nr:selenocysteine-specific translation elongation factor [bacterium]